MLRAPPPQWPIRPPSPARRALCAPADSVPATRERNRFLRRAFGASDSAIGRLVEQKLAAASAWVPPVRVYPSPAAAARARAQARYRARRQVGFDLVWARFGAAVPDWRPMLDLLKRLTPRHCDRPVIAAVRLVLPRPWELAVGSREIEFLDPATGLAARLRLSTEHHNPAAIVLRGQPSLLAKAADQLLAACGQVQVFQLGDVAASDYRTRRLWPAIEEAPQDPDRALAPKLATSIWVHQERQTGWRDDPYEATPRPATWTRRSLEHYVADLVSRRLRPHLAMRYYGRLVDTDGIRVRLILEAVADPAARPSLGPAVIKMAMAFMAHRGGHRAAASRLLALAEQAGLPMDSDLYNILLHGYVTKADAAFFHRLLLKMEADYFQANPQTWLLFLQLVQRDEPRRQIMAAMFELGLLQEPAARRAVAAIMAAHDAHAAFTASRSVDDFLADQGHRYGDDWFTVAALPPILDQFFAFHEPGPDRLALLRRLVQSRPAADGAQIGLESVNCILAHCRAASDWPTALWALSLLPSSPGPETEPDTVTYLLLLRLAVASRQPRALSLIFFYAVLGRKLRLPARRLLASVLLGRHRDRFWARARARPPIFSSAMARTLKTNKTGHDGDADPVVAAEWIILDACQGCVPSQPLVDALAQVLPTVDQDEPALQPPPAAHRRRARQPVTVQLEDAAAKDKLRLVHLEAPFDSPTMIRDWVRDRGAADSAAATDSKELAATAASSAPL